VPVVGNQRAADLSAHPQRAQTFALELVDVQLRVGRIHELARDYANFLHRVPKRSEKVHRGSRIYPMLRLGPDAMSAIVALRRLVAQDGTPVGAKSATLHPLRLKLELESALRTLGERGVHPAIAHLLLREQV